MVNKVIIVGNLGRNPEIRTAGGHTVAILRVATSRAWIDRRSGQRKEEHEWHDVEVWGRQGELCAEYLSKGRQIYVAGRLKTDHWKDKQTGRDRSRVKIVAELVEFLGCGARHTDHSIAAATVHPAVASGDVAQEPAEAQGGPEDAPAPTPPADMDELEPIP